MSLPNNALSDPAYPDALVIPDDQVYPRTVSYERGGVALNDSSLGLNVQNWKLHTDGSNIYVSPEPYTSDILVLSDTGITEVSLAFDQNMRIAVAYIQADQAKLYWFDSFAAAQVTTVLDSSISSVFLTMDDKREVASVVNSNDILLIYLKANTLYYRQQRDRFSVERALGTLNSGGTSIARCGMNSGNRMQIEVI